MLLLRIFDFLYHETEIFLLFQVAERALDEAFTYTKIL